MKMKKKIMAVLLCTVLLLNTGCSFFETSYEEYELSDTILGSTDFSEMKYEHFDPTAVKKTMEGIRKDMEDADNAEQIVKDFESIEDELAVMEASYSLAQLYNSLDANDEYYQDELVYITEVYDEIRDQYCILGKDALESPCADVLRDAWDEDDVDLFENYQAMTDNQKKLRKEEQSLENDYNKAAVKEFTYTINNQAYTMDSLLDAVYAGNITYDQYVEGYYGCMNAMADTLAPIYVDLVKVRMKIATEAGYENYNEYAYKDSYDRDYTPKDAQEFCDVVKKEMVPAFHTLTQNMNSMASTQLDMWSNSKSVDDKLETIRKYLAKVDPVLESNFDYMKKFHLYNVEYDKKKSDGGFTTFIPVYNEPFLYSQPSDSFYDFMTLIHEFGHFNSFCVNVKEASQSVQNLDLAEIASQALELLYTNFYGDMLGEGLGDAASEYTLYQRVDSVLEGCMFDEFQRRVYELDEASVSTDKINAIFVEVADEYFKGEYTKGKGDTLWVMVSHNFESPLYYISYAVSVVPALEVWEIAQTDFDKACKTYMDIVRAGEGDGYKETLERIGVGTPFEDGTMKGIADMIIKQVQ
ncbi:hypothetical protein NXH58_08000 [Agathobacter ruminis]|uniref:Peptidase M3 n=2 Tax=Agathobacter ruminis TaxID=1712665 RepID=A0A2G3E6C8_9FIRM|nr:hypothetical protein [Agathobacter ruminis]PHU38848.1 hypothetical protein CSX02_00650 [Agathobacter ruminis]